MNPKRSKPLVTFIALIAAATLQAQETNTAATAFSDIAENLAIIEFTSAGGDRKALGAIATMDGKPYLLTNQHVLLGAGKMTFTTAEGEMLSPRSVELSRDRDLARLALPERDNTLLIAGEKARMNTSIALYRTSEKSEKRVTEGTVIGIGGMKFEVSTAFGENDNGAPVLNLEGEIVGLASHNQESSRHAMKTGTRFEDAERYFCYRVDNKGWQSVNWRNYDKVFGAAYRENKELFEEIILIFKNSHGEVSERRAKELSTRCRTQARRIEKLTEKRGMTNYLLNEFEDQAELFEYAEKLFKDQASSR